MSAWTAADEQPIDLVPTGRHTTLDTTTREARPDERCSCGLRAVVVHLTERFGEVPSCRR